MENQVTPVQIMKEIERLFAKLKEGGFTKVDLVINRNTSIVEDQLVIKWSLETNKGVKVAEYTHIDPRPIEQIKAEFEAQRQAREAKFNEEVAVLDEVVTVVDTELTK